MTLIPKSHPRAESLFTRERLVSGFRKGLVAREGLLAHGRGEAFDYLVGEQTSKPARSAIRAAAACLLLAENPVISVNGNMAALCPEDVVSLADATRSRIEVSIFYASKTRKQKIARELRRNGAIRVLGNREKYNRIIPGLQGARGTADLDGIYAADVVLVPLEDGDRTEALVREGKSVISFDLNPLSRTAQRSTITIVDNVTRGMPALVRESKRLSGKKVEYLLKIMENFDNRENLDHMISEIKNNLERRARIA